MESFKTSSQPERAQPSWSLPELAPPPKSQKLFSTFAEMESMIAILCAKFPKLDLELESMPPCLTVLVRL